MKKNIKIKVHIKTNASKSIQCSHVNYALILITIVLIVDNEFLVYPFMLDPSEELHFTK